MHKEVLLFKTSRDFFIFLSALFLLFTYSLLIEFNNYKKLTQFDSNIVEATVLKQYTKTKLSTRGKTSSYDILKLKSKKGFSFYMGVKSSRENLVAKNLTLQIKTKKIHFLDYMKGFYSPGFILKIEESKRHKLNTYISSMHKDKNISAIYQALYTATPLSKELQQNFSNLGISHLFAISGFHLGVLSGLLFFLLKYPYSFFQNKFFLYRNATLDIFIFVSIILFSYLTFLDSPASLLRAFTMFIIAFVIYDRGLKVISMQTLLLTVLLLLAFLPRLFFELGFWLSVSGVFYIFLFLIHFKHLSKFWQFILVPFWVYFLMLPYSLSIFSNFSLYHPLSIIWSGLFTLFYPLSIFLHLINYAWLLDEILQILIDLGETQKSVHIEFGWIITYMFFSFLSIFRKRFLLLSATLALFIFIYSVNQVT